MKIKHKFETNNKKPYSIDIETDSCEINLTNNSNGGGDDYAYITIKLGNGEVLSINQLDGKIFHKDNWVFEGQYVDYVRTVSEEVS